MKCDVLIVGAGIAGSVSALKALRHGLKVFIIEKSKSIADTIDTKLDLTESIGIESIIKELDLPIHDTSNKSKWFSSNKVFNFNSKIYDLYIKRGSDEDSFEKQTTKRILDNGGEILFETSVKNFILDNDVVRKVNVKLKDKTLEFKPSFIVGADGVESKILHLSGLDRYQMILGEFHGYGVFGSDFNLPVGVTHVFFDRITAPGGYIFASRSKQNQCVLGVGIDPSMTGISPKGHYEKSTGDKKISDILNGSRILNNLSGYGRYGLLKKHATGNLMMVGDAGRFSDPFLCYGVRQAILSGYNAADICKSSLESSLEVEACKAFESSIRDLQNEIKLGFLLRKVYRKLDNKNIDVIVKIVSAAQNDGLDIDYLLKNNNKLLIKHILMNGGNCTKILMKAFPYIVEYFLKTHHR
jgi:flavin-dependent dehydrogenase